MSNIKLIDPRSKLAVGFGNLTSDNIVRPTDPLPPAPLDAERLEDVVGCCEATLAFWSALTDLVPPYVLAPDNPYTLDDIAAIPAASGETSFDGDLSPEGYDGIGAWTVHASLVAGECFQQTPALDDADYYPALKLQALDALDALQAALLSGQLSASAAPVIESLNAAQAVLLGGDIRAVLTSKLYPIEVLESMDAAQATLTRSLFVTRPLDAMDAAQAVLVSGTLQTLLRSYAMQPEALNAAQAGLLSGSLQTLLKTAGATPEALDAAQAVLLGGVLLTNRIAYLNYPPEGLNASQASLLSGVLQ